MAMLVYSSVVIPLNPHLLLLAFSLFFAKGPCPAKRNHPAVAQEAAKKLMEKLDVNTLFHKISWQPTNSKTLAFMWPRPKALLATHTTSGTLNCRVIPKKKSRRQWALWTLHHTTIFVKKSIQGAMEENRVACRSSPAGTSPHIKESRWVMKSRHLGTWLP